MQNIGVRSSGVESMVEQAFRPLKHRIKYFSHLKGSLARALSWLKAFTYVYSLIIAITQGNDSVTNTAFISVR